MRTSKLTITTKSRAQIRAEFKQAFKDIRPAMPLVPVTQKNRLEPYREEILSQRKRGLTWEQIAEGMAPPPIAEVVTAKLLRTVFGAADAARRQPREHLILDPVTGLRITEPVAGTPAVARTPSEQRIGLDPVTGLQPPDQLVAEAAPAPMTPKEQALFTPLIEGLIPPIVQTKMNRHAARSYANSPVEMYPPKQAARFHAVLAAELDGLNESNCARYGVTPEAVAAWKKRWV